MNDNVAGIVLWYVCCNYTDVNNNEYKQFKV